MKAIKFRSPGGIDNLQVVDVPDPGQPDTGEIRVRVRASSLNGHDLNVMRGILPVEEGRILLTDGAGIVESIGADVSMFQVGDHVVSTFFPDWEEGSAPSSTFARTPGDGLDGFAVEYVVRPANWFTHIPKGWTLQEAATLPTAGLTAWRALSCEDRLDFFETVLTIGTGGVSTFAIQFAKLMGARVATISSNDIKLQRARELGANLTLNYVATPSWADALLKMTGGRGVDLVIETGGPGTLPQSMKATRIGGKIALVGILTGVSGALSTTALMARQQSLHGITVGSKTDQLAMIQALNLVSMRPAIHSVYPLDHLGEAFAEQIEGSHFGKIVIDV